MDFVYYVNYFSMLEARLKSTRNYVAFEMENIDTFSIEFASIINDSCGLINGFLYELCHNKWPSKNRFELSDYKQYLIDEKYQISELVRCQGFVIQPWEKLVTLGTTTKNSNPIWWDNYNSIKHSGKPNFQKATLKTAVSCMAGMFALLWMNDAKHLGSTMCNWHGLFDDAGNYKKFTSWEC